MNRAIVDNYNSVVTDNDEVYFLGDLSLSHKYVGYYGRLLKGKKKLLCLGNHDCGFRRYDKFLDSYRDIGFEEVKYKDLIHIGEIPINLCHFPYENQDPRFEKYTLKDQGNWLIHGHSHHKLGKIHGKQIDVGINGWNYFPVSEVQILEIINDKRST